MSNENGEEEGSEGEDDYVEGVRSRYLCAGGAFGNGKRRMYCGSERVVLVWFGFSCIVVQYTYDVRMKSLVGFIYENILVMAM